MSSSRPDQVNRVKIITSKFEGLNGQNGSQSSAGKDSHLQKATVSRLKSDSCLDSYSYKNRVLNSNSSAKENFGPSCNFGNRKRLKDVTGNDALKPPEEKIHSKVGGSNFQETIDAEVSCSNLKILSRQNSDPVKKLQRKPAFRCDRSEKIRESRRSSSDQSPELGRQSEKSKGREKLKKLGSMIEERLKEDDLVFSAAPSKKKDSNNFKPIVDNKHTDSNITNGNDNLNKADLFESTLFGYNSDEMKLNDNIPQHILDMYAKVLKPKSRNGLSGKSDMIIKGDAVFSDSGVSSESENLISDDLEEAKPTRRNVFQKLVQSNEIDGSNENVCTNEAKLEIEPFIATNGNNLLSDSISIDEETFMNSKSALISGDISVDTLKKVLKEPLPLGPPPKKPPRIFASDSPNPNSPKKSPSKAGKLINDSKFKLKNFGSNKNKPHRSKEESKMMLDKIENALNKHKSTGKILSPRLGAKFPQEENFTSENCVQPTEDSISTASTQPSTVRLRKSSKKNSNTEESKPKEVHYMCTEILDLPFLDKHSNMNTSDGSITSSEEIQAASYLTKCFSSLNCANISGDTNRSTIMYSKFGSAPNSTNASFVDVCCYCNLKDKSCGRGNGKSDSTMRLSTFFNPNRSLDRAENNKCKRCGLNERRGEKFKCHLDCKCVDDMGNSSFFVRETQSASPYELVKYGTLLKSKSQEHIYDEPANVINQKRSENICRGEFDKRSSFVRSATLLEDGFKKFNRSSLVNVFETPSEDQFVRNDFKSKTMGRMPSEYKESKVKEISKMLEFNKKRTVSASDRCDIRISNDEDVPQKNFKTKPLHYMCSYIYDTPQAEEDNSELKNGHDFNGDRNSEKPHVPEGSGSFSKRREDRSSPGKKPPLYEKKAKDGPSTSSAQRPQRLELGASSKSGHHAKIRGLGPATDVDKKNLDRLMTEIYDTVTAVCMIDSPTKDGKISPSDFQKNFENHDASQNSLNFNDKEMTEASLQLTRSLTEKRKRYVRRVSSKVELYAPISARGINRSKTLSIQETGEPKQKEDITLSLPIKYDFKKLKAVFEQNKIADDSNKSPEIQVSNEEPVIIKCQGKLFDACAVIGMNFSTGQAYVKSVYPDHATLPPLIESLVFPESSDYYDPNDTSSQTARRIKQIKCELSPEDAQMYSLVLTNEHGTRSYGYCRRVVPEGAPFCLPLAYCIITSYRVPAFYNKILREVEIHHGSSEIVVKSILDQLYNEELPKPGQLISIKQIKSPRKSSSIDNFKKNSFYRSSVNLGDVLNKFSSNDNVKNSQRINQSESMENICSTNKSLRRKSIDLSLQFSDVFPGENRLSVVRSLEKIYGEDLKKYQDVLKKDGGFLSELKRSNLNVNENCFEREFGSRNNLDQLSSLQINEDTLGLKKSASACKVSEKNKFFESNELEFHEKPIKLMRPLEPRLEEDNLSVLFNSISVDLMVKIFGTLLLERKVILVSDKLSQLSSCVEALQSILYPFIWQHTIISTIPSYLRRDILDAPIPILAGILYSPVQKRKSNDNNKNFNKEKSPSSENSSNGSSDSKSNFYFNFSDKESHQNDLYEEIRSSNFEEGMIIDITSKNNSPSEKILKYQGDESTLLPPVLSKTLRAALQLGPSISSSDSKSDNQSMKSRNILIAEAFLRFFIVILGDYKKFIRYSPANNNSSSKQENYFEEQNCFFDKEQFVKSSPSKHIPFFLEWFTETAMFSNFIKTKSQIDTKKLNIEENIPYPGFYDIFDERVNLLEDSSKQRAETSRNTRTDSNGKNNYKLKIKTWRDKLKDLIN